MLNLKSRFESAVPIKSGRCACIALAYLVFLLLGEATTGGTTKAPLIAPPVALLASILITSRKEDWLSYCIAAGIVEYLYSIYHYRVPIQTALGFVLANLVEALLAAAYIQRRVRGQLDLSYSSHATAFIIGVGVLAPLASGVVGGFALARTLNFDFWFEVRRWWFSDSISQFILTPMILVALNPKISIDPTGIRHFYAVTALSMIVLLSTELAHRLNIAEWVTQESVFLLLPLMVWLAARAGSFWAILSTAVTTVGAIYLYSSDIAGEESSGHNLQVHLQLLLLVMSATATIAAALFEEKRRIFQELETRRESEQKSAQAKKLEALGLLTGGIAHDFNNLLGLIGLRVELAKKSIPSHGLHELHLKAASEALKKGSELVKRLLTFLREKPHAAELIDLRSSVSCAVEMLQKSKHSGIEVKFWQRDRNIFCRASVAELESAVVNLVLNARDAIDRQGTINVGVDVRTITASSNIDAGGKEIPPGNYAAVIVGDNGRGMPTEELARCFDPFFTTKAVGAGTGLGLTMVYGFARRAGGGVFAESQVGKGTTFTVLIPLEDAPESGSTTSQLRVAQSGEETILVVDDNAEFRDAVVALLRERPPLSGPGRMLV